MGSTRGTSTREMSRQKVSGRGAEIRKGRSVAKTAGHVWLLVGSKKGAFIFRGDRMRRRWEAAGPLFLGHEVNHIVQDPRDGGRS